MSLSNNVFPKLSLQFKVKILKIRVIKYHLHKYKISLHSSSTGINSLTKEFLHSTKEILECYDKEEAVFIGTDF